jgi:hypothetical protein
MWIRSQNKEELVKTNRLSILFGNQIAHLSFDEETVLGTYGTPERAMEVLGEIQSHAETLEYLKVRPEAWQGETFIYQMPEK